jgi:hypothetical protein
MGNYNKNQNSAIFNKILNIKGLDINKVCSESQYWKLPLWKKLKM